MQAEWSVECSLEDPTIVVPWSAAESVQQTGDQPCTADSSAGREGVRFLDLRSGPDALDEISEAEEHPQLLHALRALNGPRSAFFTAKCDAWPLDPDDAAALRQVLEPQLGLADPEPVPFGFASYIDLLWRDRSRFASFHQQEQFLHRLTRYAEPLDAEWASLECILRPALVEDALFDDGTHAQTASPQWKEGFAITVYVQALGEDAESAYRHWEEALSAVVTLLRARDWLTN